MEKHKPVLFTPEEKSKALDSVMVKVKKQVKRYKDAKRSGKLRKVTDDKKALLFNV